MRRHPLAGRIYVFAMIALGAVLMASALSSWQLARPGLFAVLLVMSVISSALKVDMPLGVGSSCISLSYAVDFTALLLLGPAPTMLIAVASGWSQSTFRMSVPNPAYKTLFSMATLAVSVAAAGATYTGLGGTNGALSPQLQPMMAAALVYFLVNSLAVAAAFALSSGRRVLRVWHDNFLWTISSYVVGAIAAGIAVEVFHRAGEWHTALAFVPLGLTYRSYRIYLKRITDEQRRVSEWAQLHRESTEVLARAIQAKDEGGSRHVERVQYYATMLAHRLDLPELDRQAVEIAALLHDIGKLAVPEHILSKPGPLTPDERKKMQLHAQIGAEIVSAVPFPCPVAPLIRSHHERWDGTGYPSGLCSEQIPVGARILAVVDCYDALTSRRPYRQALSPDEAVQMLRDEAGKAFDPAIVARFTELLPVLTPPANDGVARRTRGSERAGEPAASERGERLGADAFAEIASANRETNLLYEIAQSMGRSMSLADSMTVVSAKLSALLPVSLCALFVRRGDGDLRCRFATGLHADRLENATIAEGNGLSGWVVRHGRPLVNGVPATEFSAAGTSCAGLLLQSALICPLAVGDEVIGAIAVYHDRVGSFTEDHRRVLDQVALQAASVVHNALIFERSQDQALKDALTGLANPRALQFQAEREIGRARRTATPFSLVLMDLDDFKAINDEYGHLVGDRALQEVARVLQQSTRSYDTCIRYGGDEFVILLPSCDWHEAEERCRELQGAVAALSLRSPDGRDIPLRMSAGASVFPEDGETYERLLVRADRRMYRNKARSKARQVLVPVEQRWGRRTAAL